MYKKTVLNQGGGYNPPVTESFELSTPSSFLSTSGPGNTGIDDMEPWDNWGN